LLIISRESQKSIWVEKEIDFAINNRKTIVPLKITSEPLTDEFRFYLNNVQAIYYGDSKKKALDTFRFRLRRLLKNELEENKSDVNSVNGNNGANGIDTTFGINPQPVVCKYCNGKLKMIVNGIYKCINCGKENYDYFNTVKNYLEKAGPRSRIAIEKATGIPRKSIDYFFSQEKLEIPEGSNIRRICQKCGDPIRTGLYCDRCKKIIRK
jgi:hypothetical protein